MFAVTKNTVKVGPISVNFRNGKVNFDRRTLKGKDMKIQMAVLAAAGVATAVVASKIVKKDN